MSAVTGFAEMPDADLLALFSDVGRAVSSRFLNSKPILNSWGIVLDYLKSAMAHRETEQFRVLFLDKKNRLIADDVMGDGTVDHCPVYIRELAKRALMHNASAIILTHNHPSGDTTPSKADVAMTKEIIEALKVFGIAVHDHVIVSKEGHASMKALQLI